MRPRIVASILQKDALDALRDSRVLVSLLTPILLAVLYNVLFPERGFFEAKVAYTGSSSSALLASLEQRAADSVRLQLRQVDGVAAARDLVERDQADVALVLPDGVDEAIRAGRVPEVTLLVRTTSPAAVNFVKAALGAGARELAGQPVPLALREETVKAGPAEQGVMGELGPRRYFVLATIVMMLGMVALLVVPIVLTEEAERRTLDALLLVASYGEVIAAKALLGVAYSVVSVAVMLGLTRLAPADPPTFVAGAGLLTVALIGLGLLLGGLFRTAGQVYTWSSLLLIPVIGPAFTAGLPVPAALDMALRAFPTSQAMRPMTNGLAGRELFPDVGVSYAALIVWAVAAFTLLAWRLSRRES